jgi:maltooligosyltrehalose trehalohydrolase
MDGVWSDDFHHQIRRGLAGDTDGYFRDFSGAASAIAETARQGWFFCGQHAAYFGGPRGSDPTGVEYARFVFFVQNHDQVGNRARGDRIHKTLDPAAYRTLCALFLLLPETPLLFMGQEWAASTPFLFFTDHNPQLGRRVVEGRRREFRKFKEFADPSKRTSIPNPQALKTFEASKLRWEEREREPHRSMTRLVKRLLQIRRSDPAFRAEWCSGQLPIEALDADTLAFRRVGGSGKLALIVARFGGQGDVNLEANPRAQLPDGYGWEVLLTTEDPEFAPDPAPARIGTSPPEIRFNRSGAVVLHAVRRES